MKQLFANNASSTLATPIVVASSSILLTDGSIFPSPSANEFFSVTIELGDQREICYCNSRIGNSLNIYRRGAEGTTPQSFPAGTKVECRVTRDTLSKNIRSFIPVSSVNDILPPKDAYGDSFVCGTLDPSGSPVIVARKDNTSWTFLNYTRIGGGLVTSATTTSVAFGDAGLATGVAPGKYLIQHEGRLREVLGQSGSEVSWSAELEEAPSVGDTVDIYKANSSMSDLTEIIDDAFVTALIMSN